MVRRGPRARERAEVVAAVEPAEAVESPGTDVSTPLPEPAPPEVPLPEDPAELLAHWRQRVLQNGSDVASRRELARLYAARGEQEQALEQYEAAKVLAPEDADLIVESAEMQIGLRRFELAERELRRLLKLQPDQGSAHLALGTASFRRGLYGQAEQELRRAVELLPGNPIAPFYRGEALNQLERVDEALDMLERTVSMDPSNSRAYYVMGILYDKKGRPQDAATYFKKAREVGGS